MYSASSMVSNNTANGVRPGMVDGSGTINPAALNSAGAYPDNSTSLHPQASPRGTKRNRSQESEHEVSVGEDPSAKRRGKGQKIKGEDDTGPQSLDNGSEQLRTPVSQPSLLPQEPHASPRKTSPPKSTSSKPVLKALPTVRDHTTDMLTPEGDEYVPREIDEAGEKKVNGQGHLLDDRQYRMRVFYVPNRGEKLFMLATECARVLNYRDSYLLFNKNRSLYKIIATQTEKDELIHQEILPYSYRSRQIAIVTARSMFRQFGARVIVDGRRVKDDYWEAKAKKQGFTEADMAGEKRPGGGNKAREVEQAPTHAEPPITGRPEIVYSMPLLSQQPIPQMQMPMPMIQTEPRDFGGISRQKLETTAPPYQDHTQRAYENDILHQAANASENNKSINQQRMARQRLYEDSWNRPHDSPVHTPRQKIESSPVIGQSPNLHPSSSLSQSSAVPTYTPSRAVASPIRQPMPTGVPQQSPQNRSTFNPTQHASLQTPYAGYPSQSNQLWGHPPPPPAAQPQPQQQHPHQSPMSPHHPALPHYSPSPHPAQSPLHQQPSHSPHPQQQPPAPINPQGAGPLHAGMPYQGMAGMPRAGAAGASPYAGMPSNRAMWGQQPPQQPGHMAGHQQPEYLGQMTAAGQTAGTQGWAPTHPQAGQQWANYPVSSSF